ncbi:MAG: hypothetical protein QNJ12_23065 [Ilumatobacter sp.]|uniref:hypothetical protein n=1 Tax=Ilumatobacter sp. TaxID=1967498 RepID=UPI002605D5FF|nr:hypothetical protein [Ilumatobacter sp.]MDJ0771686.1 hypothetical protein [Ilumatobacter sp.]
MNGHKLVGVVLVVAMLGVWAIRSFVLDTGASEPSTRPAEASSTVPGQAGVDPAETQAAMPVQPVVAAGDLAEVPVGYPRSERGAATSAVNWVASFPTVVRMGPIRLDDTLGQLLSERRAASGTDEVVADYFMLIDELGPDFASRVWIESPLQVDILDADASTATVAVWALLVTGDPEHGPIEALWRTHRIDLVWERDDWRIDDVVITEGPTPIPNEVALPSPASDFVTVDAWEAAVFADTTTEDDH